MASLRKGFGIILSLSCVVFVVLATHANSWGAQVNRTQDADSESKASSETFLTNNISRKLTDNKNSPSGINDKPITGLNIQQNDLRVLKSKLFVKLKAAVIGAETWQVTVVGNHPTPSSFILGSVNPTVELYSGDYEVKLKYLDANDEMKEQHDVVLSNDCKGKISGGQEKTCEVALYLWPHIVVYTHATAKDTKASDFTIEALGDKPYPATFKGNEEGTNIQMRYGDYGVHFKPENGFFADYSTTQQNPCFGKLEDDGSGFAPIQAKAFCNITIDISMLKVTVKKDGGPSPVSAFKYKVKSNDVNVNGPLLDPKIYQANSQGTNIPIGPGAVYTVEMLPFNNFGPIKSGDCENGQAELGKIKSCTITMKYDVEQDNCTTEINEQGKPVKVC